MKKLWSFLILVPIMFTLGGCIPGFYDNYTIILKESQVSANFYDFGGPDQYVVVKHNDTTILWTEVKGDRYHAYWWNESANFKFWTGDVLKVWLMDSDFDEDDVIAYWVVYDPTDLTKLSKDGHWVKFSVTKSST